jgi:phage shock protein A
MNPLFIQKVMAQASQMAQQFQNPQQLIQQMMPDIPAEIRNNPQQIINWMQQNGRISPQQVQMAQQMMGRR